MKTQKNQFAEVAYMRHQCIWRDIEALFRRGGSATSSAYRESVHVNYYGMRHRLANNLLLASRLKKAPA